MEKKQIYRNFFVFSVLALTVGVFQNCSKVKFSSDHPADGVVLESGGESYSGKTVRYLARSAEGCSDGSDVKAIIEKTGEIYTLVRKDCQDLASGQLLSPDEIVVSSETEISYQGELFTEEKAIVYPSVVLSTFSPNQQIQISHQASAGVNFCLSQTDAGEVFADRCVHTWRQRYIAEQIGSNWRFQVSGSSNCLEMATNSSEGGRHHVGVVPCDPGDGGQLFELQCADRLRHVNSGAILIVSEQDVYGLVDTDACAKPETQIAPVEWIPEDSQ